MPLIEPLDEETASAKQEQLADLLFTLSNDYVNEEEDSIEYRVSELSDIYGGGFRHLYSNMHLIIAEIYNGDPYNVVVLLENIELLRTHVKSNWEMKEYPEHLYGNLLKLSDHLNLEYQRHIESLELQAKIDAMYKKTKNDLRKVRKKASRIQTEVVFILAIFAAIVMAFSGGLTILGGSLAGISSAGPLKLAFVIILCGIVVFNTIALLMHAIGKIVVEFYDPEDEFEGKSPIEKLARSIEHSLRRKKFKHWYVVLFNVLLLSMLALDVCLWYVYGEPPTSPLSVSFFTFF